MEAYYARGVLGVFAFEKDGKLMGFEPFPEDPGKIALRIFKDTIEEEEVLLGKLSLKDAEKRQALLVRELGVALDAASVSREDYRKLVREVSFRVVESRLKETPKDLIIIQAIEALDDIEEATNLLSERFGEWHGLCYPHGEGEGPRAPDTENQVLEGFRERISGLDAFKKELDDYIASLMEETAPNLAGLLGPGLGARLLSLSGGLERLSRMPSSKIQVLGAEKALFKHIKDKSPPPKHGAIFQFPAIKGSPWWQRGKIARTLANKIAIAVRADAFSGEYLADDLKAQFEKRVKGIKKAHPDEPKKMRIIRTPPEKRGTRRKGGKKKRRRKR
jgi:nucleolar protein 56